MQQRSSKGCRENQTRVRACSGLLGGVPAVLGIQPVRRKLQEVVLGGHALPRLWRVQIMSVKQRQDPLALENITISS